MSLNRHHAPDVLGPLESTTKRLNRIGRGVYNFDLPARLESLLDITLRAVEVPQRRVVDDIGGLESGVLQDRRFAASSPSGGKGDGAILGNWLSERPVIDRTGEPLGRARHRFPIRAARLIRLAVVWEQFGRVVGAYPISKSLLILRNEPIRVLGHVLDRPPLHLGFSFR